jgi:hypothetical protein
MFEQRPVNVPNRPSRVFETANTVADLGTRTTGLIDSLRKRIMALICFYMAFMWAIGALDSLSRARTVGQQIFVLLFICVVSGGFMYAGRRCWAGARSK